jgi:hypothetical protein
MTTRIETVEVCDVRDVLSGAKRMREVLLTGRGWVRIKGKTLDHMFTKTMRARMPITTMMVFQTSPHPVTGAPMVMVRPYDPDRKDNQLRAHLKRSAALGARLQRKNLPRNPDTESDTQFRAPVDWLNILEE